MNLFAPKRARQPATYGYARVSSAGQNLDRQLDALKSAGIEESRTFCDRKSGKDFDRPGWTKLERRLRKGDTLVIPSLDRLGRNYVEILEKWRCLTNHRGVSIRVLDMPLLNTGGAYGLVMRFIVELVLRVLAFVAECERKHIHERQKAGIEAAKRRGVKFGRPRIELPPQFVLWAAKTAAKEVRQTDAARECGLPPTTFRRYYQAWKDGVSAPESRPSHNPLKIPHQNL